MATLFSDDFNRANGSAGANWAAAGTGTTTISSNQLKTDVDRPCKAYATTTALSAVADCKVSFTQRNTTGWDCGPSARVNATTADTLYYLSTRTSDNQVSIYRRVSDVDTLIGSTTSAGIIGTIWTLEAVGTGTSITLKGYKDGTQILSLSDTNGSRITAAGQPGLMDWGPANLTDDFLVEVDSVGTATGTGAATADGQEIIPDLIRLWSATGTTTGTFGTHRSGDIIYGYAFRDGSATLPTLPAGWTSIQAPTGANTCSGRLAYKIAASSSETAGTWTNATSTEFVCYRPANNSTLSVGASTTNTGASTTLTYGALTLQDAAGKSWVIGFGGHRSADVAIETAPSGMTNVTSVSDATDEAAIHDTNAGVTAWSSQTAAVGGTSSGWLTFVVELRTTAVFSSWPYKPMRPFFINLLR